MLLQDSTAIAAEYTPLSDTLRRDSHVTPRDDNIVPGFSFAPTNIGDCRTVTSNQHIRLAMKCHCQSMTENPKRKELNNELHQCHCISKPNF